MAMGLSLLMPSFFKSMDRMDYLSERYHASLLAGEALAGAEYALAKGLMTPEDMRKTRTVGGRDYECRLEARRLSADLPLQELSVTVSWQRGQRVHEIFRKVCSYAN